MSLESKDVLNEAKIVLNLLDPQPERFFLHVQEGDLRKLSGVACNFLPACSRCGFVRRNCMPLLSAGSVTDK